MVPENLRFGGGVAESTIHPLAAIYLLIAVVLILVVPRRTVIAPFLVAFFTIPIGNVIVLGGLHFTALRALILAGLVRRALTRGSTSAGKYPGGFNSLDWAVFCWSISAVVAFCLEFRETQAYINAAGTLLDTLGGYLVIRFLVPDREAIKTTIKVLAAICVINGVCMINEKFIGHFNVFGLLGGMDREVTVRDGHIRAAGVMGCLYAGAFAGVLIPLFIWLWKERKSRLAALAGFAGATAMMITSYSSTSYLAYGGALAALAFWPLRKRMRILRWGLTVMLVGLHMVMKAPVWALIARIDLTGSSSGEQRYQIVDMTIRNFSAWWLIGTKDYVSWGWDSWDLCNQFVAVALTGGLLALICYIAIFKVSFSSIGNARKLVEGNQEQEWLFWCFGSALFATVVAHFGINYMAQLIMGVFALVVCISVASSEVRQTAVQTSEAPIQKEFGFVPSVSGVRLRLGVAKREPKHSLSPRQKERLAPWMKA
jgi:hypothetical protein